MPKGFDGVREINDDPAGSGAGKGCAGRELLKRSKKRSTNDCSDNTPCNHTPGGV